MEKYKIYLDDVRTPIDNGWIVVRNYTQFVNKIEELGLNNIELISLDHDLDNTAMDEYYNNVSPNYKLDYNNIKEKTGLDCAKWLIDHFYGLNPKRVGMNYRNKMSSKITFPLIHVHSANPIGAANIMGYINNFLMNEGKPQTCIRIKIEHTIN